MELTITLKCIDVIEAQQVLAQLRGPAPKIDPLDNPETGMNYPAGVVAAQVQQPSTASLANVGFGQGTVLPTGAVPATPAPSTAAAVPSATASAVPSGIPAVPTATQAPAAPTAPAADAPAAPGQPAAAPSASVPPAAGVELDSTGLPHDRRIHASTKSKKQDGSWTALRGVDPALKIAVEQELRNLMAANAAAGIPAAPSSPAVPSAQAPAVAVVPDQAPVAPVAPPAAAGDPENFAQLMERLTPLMEAGKITPDRIAAHLQPMKLSGFGQLAIAPNLIPQFWASIKPEVAAAGLGL